MDGNEELPIQNHVIFYRMTLFFRVIFSLLNNFEQLQEISSNKNPYSNHITLTLDF